MVEHDASSFQALSIGISNNGLASITNESSSSLSSQPQPHIYDHHRKVTNGGRLQRPPRPRLRVLSTVEQENDRIGEVGTIAGMSVGVGSSTGAAVISGFESNHQSLGTTRTGVVSSNVPHDPFSRTNTITPHRSSTPQNASITHALTRQRRLEASRSAGSLLTTPLDGSNLSNMDINGQRLAGMNNSGRNQSNSNELLVGNGIGAGTSSSTGTSGLGGMRAAAAAASGNVPRSHQRRRIASIGHGLGGSGIGIAGGSVGGNGGGSGVITNGGGSGIGIGLGSGTGNSQSAVGNMLRDAVIADALVGQGLGLTPGSGPTPGQGLG